MANKKKLVNAVDKLLGATEPEEATTPEIKKESLIGKMFEEDPKATSEEELEKALKAHQNSKRGRPKKWEGSHSSEGEVRTSIVIKEEQLAKLKEISLRETLTLKEVMEASFALAIENYENKFGEIVPKDRTPKAVKSLFK